MQLVPNKRYELMVTFLDHTNNYRVSFEPVDGYRVMIDKVSKLRAEGHGGGGMVVQGYDVWLEPNEPAGAVGMAESITGGNRIFWRVAMGGLKNGGSAGNIEIREAGFSANVFTPGALVYNSASSDVDVVIPGGVLRQVKAPKALADIVTLSSTSYEIRFYAPNYIGAKVNGEYTLTGGATPFVKYKVEQYAGSSTKIRITKYVGARSWQTRLEQSGSVWTLFDWYEGASHLRKKIWTVDVNGDVTIDVQNGSGALVTRNREDYSTYGWGQELWTEYFGYGYQNLDTVYDYYSDRKIKSMIRPDGSWIKYEYMTGFLKLLSKTYEPYEDYVTAPPATSNWEGKVTTYTYENDWQGQAVMPDVVETKIKMNGGASSVTTAKTEYAYNFTQTISASGRTLPLVEVKRRDHYNASGGYLETVTKSFRPDADVNSGTNPYYLQGLTHSVVNPDKTVVAHVYLRGQLSAGVFTPSATGADRAEHVYIGSTDPAAGTILTVTGDNGSAYGVETLYLVPHVSSRKETVRNSVGDVIWTADYLYTGTGYAFLGGEYSTYDTLGNLTQITEYQQGAAGYVSYVTYTATYADGLKTVETDRLGATTTYTNFDAMGRPTKQVKQGYGTIPSIETHFEYDAEGRVTKTKLGATSQIITTSSYDYAGRVTQEAAPGQSGNITVSYSYPSDRVVRKTYPDGGYVDETFFYDGRLKSVTGTAVIPKYVDYSIDPASGVEEEKTALNSALTHGWKKIRMDWLGRPHSEEAPTNTGSTAVVSYVYDATKGQLTKKTFKNGSGTLLAADERYDYDKMGRVSREWLDIDDSVAGGASAEFSGPDRIKEYVSDHVSENIGGLTVWYSRLETKTYPFDGSGTVLSLGQKRERVSGFTSTLLSESKVIDVHGNQAVTSVTANLSTKEVTSVTSVAGVTGTAEQRSTNGFVTYSRSKEGVVSTFQYDAWGRKTKDVGRDSVETTYEYYAGTTLLYRTLNVFFETGRWSYDTSGRVVYARQANDPDAQVREQRYSYNAKGQKTRQWGSGIQPAEYVYDTYGYGFRTQLKTFRAGTGWDGAAWPSSPGTGDTTTWGYDYATGQVTSKTDAASKTVTTTYNDRGQVLKKTHARC